MSKQLKNRTATLKVKFYYEDESLNLYEGTAFVTMNIGFEIEKVDINEIHAFNENDEQISPEMSVSIVEQLESIAGMKAMENIEMIDFEKESERE